MWHDGRMALIVIDARSPAEYAMGHLRGAVNIDRHSPGLDARLALLNPRDSYVVYCNGGHRAGQLRERLEALGCCDAQSSGIRAAQMATGLPIVMD